MLALDCQIQRLAGGFGNPPGAPRVHLCRRQAADTLLAFYF